jgi:hypothetical protein
MNLQKNVLQDFLFSGVGKIHCKLYIWNQVLSLWGERFFFFLVVLEIELQGLVLAKQVLYHFSHSKTPLCIGYF